MDESENKKRSRPSRYRITTPGKNEAVRCGPACGGARRQPGRRGPGLWESLLVSQKKKKLDVLSCLGRVRAGASMPFGFTEKTDVAY
jgi:hypothetical protein